MICVPGFVYFENGQLHHPLGPASRRAPLCVGRSTRRRARWDTGPSRTGFPFSCWRGVLMHMTSTSKTTRHPLRGPNVPQEGSGPRRGQGGRRPQQSGRDARGPQTQFSFMC